MKVRVERGPSECDDWAGPLVVLEDTPGGSLRVWVQDDAGAQQLVRLYARGQWTGAYWVQAPELAMRERMAAAYALPQPLRFAP